MNQKIIVMIITFVQRPYVLHKLYTTASASERSELMRYHNIIFSIFSPEEIIILDI